MVKLLGKALRVRSILWTTGWLVINGWSPSCTYQQLLTLRLVPQTRSGTRVISPEVEKAVDSVSLTRRKYFQKLGLTENIWENIMG